MKKPGACLFALAWVVSSIAPAAAQGTSLAGKTVRMVIGNTVAGTYDLLGRLVARHIGKHLPGNPQVVPQNMPGGGGLVSANYLYNVAPRDGTVMAIFNKGVAGAAIAGVAEARFDATKMTWLGTPFSETGVCFAYNRPTLQVRSIKDALEKELIVGDPGAGSSSHIYPKALNALVGSKFKLVAGYSGSPAIYLAMERGEVDGYCEGIDGIMAKRPQWIPNKQIVLLLQGGAAPNPDLKDVPFINDYALTPDNRVALEYLYAAEGIGRPFAAPPALTPEIRAMVRDAFDDTMRDAEFLADARRQGFDPRPENGDHLDTIIRQMAATPQAIKARVLELSR
jgi:tripartite-type tricarboxylate transporter receptor subunit TctC